MVGSLLLHVIFEALGTQDVPNVRDLSIFSQVRRMAHFPPTPFQRPDLLYFFRIDLRWVIFRIGLRWVVFRLGLCVVSS